ncbi:MAG: hypothetical protein AB7F35_13150 [Acetobacteraceae bacterium]
MSDRIFQEAYARVRSRYTEEAWLSLNPRQITDAIYREIRLIDAERVREREAGQTGEANGADAAPPIPKPG